MQLVIKRASFKDAKTIAKLFNDIGVNEVIINEEFFNSDNNIVVVAYAEGKAAGFLYGYVLADLKNANKMFLYSIDVIEKYQRKGIATKLIEILKDIAKENNCSEIFVFTNDYNAPAKKAYEKTGGVRINKDDVMYVYEPL